MKVEGAPHEAGAPDLSVKRASPPPGRRTVPSEVVLQMEVTECGAACLGSVLATHGCHRTLEELRRICGVTRDGSNALSIVQAARHHGMEAGGAKVEPGEFAEVDLPAILFWGFNHFVVLEGYGGGRWRIMDPASGRRWVDPAEFGRKYTGVVLTMRRGEGFQPSGTRPSTTAALVGWMGGSWKAMALALVAGALLAAPGLVIPALSAVFIDSVLGESRDSWLMPLTLIGAAALLIQIGVAFGQGLLLSRLEQRLAVTASTTYLSALLRLPVGFFTHRMSGELVSRVQSADSIAGFLAGRFVPIAIEAVVALIYFAVMLALDTPLALLALAAAMLVAGLMAVTGSATTDAARVVDNDCAQHDGVLAAGLEAIDSVKASGREADLFSQCAGALARLRVSRQVLAERVESVGEVVPLVEAIFASAVVLAFGGWQVMQGELSVGGLLAFQVILIGFLGPFVHVAALWQDVQESRADLSRLDDVLRHPSDPLAASLTHSGDFAPLRGEVELKDIVFGYSESADPLVHDVSIRVAPGRRIAIVGGTGSGKSTLGKLACGLYRPWSGEVRIDGHELSSVPRAARTAGLAVVSQTIALFEGSLRDNLTLWDTTIPDAWIEEAINDAQLQDLIASRGGLDGFVAEGGTNFSGGEAQRIEIARALVRRPAVIVLDEATSALDALTEHAIDQALRARGLACIVIAHRLSTIRDADEIAVLDAGTIVERGTHEELMQNAGVYATLMEGGA